MKPHGNKISFRWSWTNWTFGVWWDRTKLRAWGVDLGPFEVVVRR